MDVDLLLRKPTQTQHNVNKKHQLNPNSKFNEAKRLLNEIAQIMSKESAEVFQDRIEQLILIKSMWEENINFNITAISPDKDLNPIEASIYVSNEETEVNGINSVFTNIFSIITNIVVITTRIN